MTDLEMITMLVSTVESIQVSLRAALEAVKILDERVRALEEAQQKPE